MKIAHTLVFLAAFALAACSRDDGVLFDGKSLFSKTEKGRIEVSLPTSSTPGSEVLIGLDRLLEIARTELPNYSARPAAEWELVMLLRHRLASGSHYYVFQFKPIGSFEEWIQIPVSSGGNIIARPKAINK